MEGEHIKSLYKLMVDINYPSLYYIGLNKIIVPFPQYQFQSEYAVACITGNITPPPRQVTMCAVLHLGISSVLASIVPNSDLFNQA